MKKLSLLVLTSILAFYSFSQSSLTIKTSNKGSYIEHTVAAKENFYSISRIYNVHPKEIASFNDLDMAKGLSIGQVIRVPVAKPVEVKMAAEPVEQPETKNEELVTNKTNVIDKAKITVSNEGQGFFKSDFEQQTNITPARKTETVTSGIFRTTSGWQDAKYYMLIDDVQPGTIIKLINPGNNKIIYAKVLGEMSGIRQNEGYNVRISTAAATALSVTDDEKFIVKIQY